MKTTIFCWVSLILVGFLLGTTGAEEVRYFQENGITYRETYRTIQRQIPETSFQQTTRTVYKTELNTENREMIRTSWEPVTVYRLQTELVGRWNFFIEPYYETRWVAETQWAPRSERVKVPVACQKLVPESQTVQVPITRQKTVSEKILVSRVAIEETIPKSIGTDNGPVSRPPLTAVPSPTSFDRYPSLSSREPIGGVKNLLQDSPR